jgi:excisionase family DNA binding protein
MEKNNNQEIDRATRWVKQKVSEIGYGEIGINLVIHQGEICKTEYKIIEKKIALDPATKPSPPRAKQEGSAPKQNPKPTKNIELIRVDSVAEMLGVHPVSVRRWVSQGKIPHIKIGSAIRFDRDKIVDHFLNKQ